MGSFGKGAMMKARKRIEQILLNSRKNAIERGRGVDGDILAGYLLQRQRYSGDIARDMIADYGKRFDSRADGDIGQLAEMLSKHDEDRRRRKKKPVFKSSSDILVSMAADAYLKCLGSKVSVSMIADARNADDLKGIFYIDNLLRKLPKDMKYSRIVDRNAIYLSKVYCEKMRFDAVLKLCSRKKAYDTTVDSLAQLREDRSRLAAVNMDFRYLERISKYRPSVKRLEAAYVKAREEVDEAFADVHRMLHNELAKTEPEISCHRMFSDAKAYHAGVTEKLAGLEKRFAALGAEVPELRDKMVVNRESADVVARYSALEAALDNALGRFESLHSGISYREFRAMKSSIDHERGNIQGVLAFDDIQRKAQRFDERYVQLNAQFMDKMRSAERRKRIAEMFSPKRLLYAGVAALVFAATLVPYAGFARKESVPKEYHLSAAVEEQHDAVPTYCDQQMKKRVDAMFRMFDARDRHIADRIENARNKRELAAAYASLEKLGMEMQDYIGTRDYKRYEEVCR